MTLKAFRKPSSVSPDSEVLARAVLEYSQQLTQNPLLDGQLIQNISISAIKTVNHSLGRPWVGFIVTNRNTASTVSATRTNVDNLMIQLSASTPVVVDIWIF